MPPPGLDRSPHAASRTQHCLLRTTHYALRPLLGFRNQIAPPTSAMVAKENH